MLKPCHVGRLILWRKAPATQAGQDVTTDLAACIDQETNSGMRSGKAQQWQQRFKGTQLSLLLDSAGSIDVGARTILHQDDL